MKVSIQAVGVVILVALASVIIGILGQVRAENASIRLTVLKKLVEDNPPECLTDQECTSNQYCFDTSCVTDTRNLTWGQRGAAILRITPGFTDGTGTAVALSDIGNAIAVGSPYYDPDGGGLNETGALRVFDFNGTTWVQRGPLILGRNHRDEEAFYIDLVSDGQTVVTNSISYSGNGNLTGDIRVFNWTGANWVQRGTSIRGAGENESSALRFDCSPDCTTIAVAFVGETVAGNALSGVVRVYDWNSSDWIQRGEDITSGLPDDKFGDEVFISDNTNTVAYTAKGRVGAVSWNGTAWRPQGADIGSGIVGTGSGIRMHLSADGSSIVAAAGSSGSDIYILDWNNTAWEPRGSPIGPVSGTADVSKVKLTPDGNAAAVAFRVQVPGGIDFNDQGLVQVYIWNGTDWVPRGSPISDPDNMSPASTFFGNDISISRDGQVLTIGSPGFPNKAYIYELGLD